jgi:hypothetical protein
VNACTGHMGVGGGPMVFMGCLNPQQHTHLHHSWVSEAEGDLGRLLVTQNLASGSSRMCMASLPLGCTCTPPILYR